MVKLGSGVFEGPYSFDSRFEKGPGTNPEELLGAAHAGCFTMAFAAGLTRDRFSPKRIHTTAKVNIDKIGNEFKIIKIELFVEAEVPNILPQVLIDHAEEAKNNCPISRVLTGTEITMEVKSI